MLSTNLMKDFIEEVVGEDVMPLILFLKDKKNVSEFLIAEKLNISIHQVRNMLYRLDQHNLLEFIRKKDKKKGWYIYYWSLAVSAMDYAARKYLDRKMEEFQERLAKEEAEMFFVCPSGCMRMKHENALENDFKCGECGALLVKDENKKTIMNLKKRIEELTAELKRYEAEKAERVKPARTKPKKMKMGRKKVTLKKARLAGTGRKRRKEERGKPKQKRVLVRRGAALPRKAGKGGHRKKRVRKR